MIILEIMRKRIKKHKAIYNILKLFLTFSDTVYQILEAVYCRTILLFFSMLKINNKKIMIVNYSGKGYGDSGKYICKELIKYNYEIYRATNEKYRYSLPKEINYAKINSIKYLYHLATAKIRINNSRFPYKIRKRNEQFYIQTWHGCIVFKKVESAAESSLSKYYVLSAKNDSKMANLFVSNSTF